MKWKKPTVDERRAEILDGAIKVLIDRGFAKTRVADVAKRLDVSTSLIHYHFESKETLLAEAFAQAANQDIAELEADIEAAPTAVGKLDALIRNYVPEGSDDVEWMLWIDAWGEALRNPELRKISQRLDAESLALIERVLRIGVERGEFVCADVPASAMRLAGLIDGLAVQFAAHDGVLNADQIIAHVRTAAAQELGIDVEAFDHPLEAPRRAGGGSGPAAPGAGRRTRTGGRAGARAGERGAGSGSAPSGPADGTLQSAVERYHAALAAGDTGQATAALLHLLDGTGRSAHT